MDPLTILIATQAGGLLLSGIGAALAAGDEAKARGLLQQVADQYGPEMAQRIASMKPEEVQATALQGMKVSGEGRDAQMRALAALEAEVAQAGFGASDRASLALAQNEAAAMASGNAATAAQSLAQRGQGGSPMAAALQSAAGQQGTNAAGTLSYQAQRDAMQRRLQAIEAAGEFGGKIRGADYAAALDKAKAQDAINAFNANARWQTQQEKDRMEMERQAALAAARGGQAQGYYQSAQGTRGAFGGAGQGVSTAGSGWAQYQAGRKP